MNYRFRPPRPNPFVIGTINLLFPLLLPLLERIVRVRVEVEGTAASPLAPSGRAVLLLPNHPSETEPVVMTYLARRAGEPFRYLATHEIFQGWRAWLVQRMGAFSVLRGRPDRASLRTATRLLADDGRKLVVFPEGETHMQNDLILPFKRGALQIGFWALERQQALGKPVTLPVVPVAVRYGYVGDARPALLAGMTRLERHLGLPARANDALADRLRRACLVVLDGVEREYGLRRAEPAWSRALGHADEVSDELPPGALNARLLAVTARIAARVRQVVPVASGVAHDETAPLPLRMRALFNATFDYLDGMAEGKTFYERRLHARRITAARACLADLWRLQNFMVFGEGTLAPPLSLERLGEVLFRLEKEVYGNPRTRPWREAVVRLGAPVDLADWLPDYQASRKQALAWVTNVMEERLRTLLASCSSPAER